MAPDRIIATAAHQLTIAQRRANLAEQALTRAEEALGSQWDGPVIVTHWGTETKMDERGRPASSRTVWMTQEIPHPTISDRKTLMATAAAGAATSLKLTGDDAGDAGVNVLVQIRQALVMLPPEQRAMLAERLAVLDVVDAETA